jgi:hypothetical protein
MAAQIASRFRALSIASCVALGACTATPRIHTVQTAAIGTAPRAATFTLDEEESLPFGISRARVEAGLARAGFPARGNDAPYRLLLSASAGSSRSGSFVPDGAERSSRVWVGRPDRSLAGRIFPGHMLRVTAVLLDRASNREVWRGSGSLRTADPAGDAQHLVDAVLAKLPRS